MIIENAFWKLPEFLTSNFIQRETSEASVVNLFVIATLMELNTRNIPRHFEHVLTEKPYPTKGLNNRSIHADLYVNLNEAFQRHGYIESYGTRSQNWIEVKAFLASVRKIGGTPPTTENVGKIIRDLLRLCLLPEELQGTIRQNGRYLLLVFSDSPSKSLAMTTSAQKRDWLSKLLNEGYGNLQFDLSKEPEALRKAVGLGFVDSSELSLYINFRTMMFRPDENTRAKFWGYLIRILSFKISLSNLEIEFDDILQEHWDKNQIERLKLVQNEVIEKMSRAKKR